MLLKVRDFLATKFAQDTDPSKDQKIDKIHRAAAALLVDAALLDGSFGEAERQQIILHCVQNFDMAEADALVLIAAAEEQSAKAVDLHGYINEFAPHFDYADRLTILESLWAVAYADGHLHDYEANLIRRVTGLLGISDKENGAARKRVLARIADVQ